MLVLLTNKSVIIIHFIALLQAFHKPFTTHFIALVLIQILESKGLLHSLAIPNNIICTPYVGR